MIDGATFRAKLVRQTCARWVLAICVLALASFIQVASPAAALAGCPFDHPAGIKHEQRATTEDEKQERIRKYLKARTSQQSTEAASIAHRERGPAPLSFAQEQIWLHGQFAKDANWQQAFDPAFEDFIVNFGTQWGGLGLR